MSLYVNVFVSGDTYIVNSYIYIGISKRDIA